VRVSGHRTASGAIRATRVDREPGSHEDLDVKGFVAALDAAAQPPAFGLQMVPGGATVYQVTLATGAALPAGLRNGSFVEVRSAARPVGGAMTAAAVELEEASGGARDDDAEVEGLVTSGDSAAFAIGSQHVTTSSTTAWENGLPEDLLPGVKVEVEGRIDARGALQARKVSYRWNVRLQGAGAGVDAPSGTFQVLGLTVRTDALTEWRSSGGGSALDLAGTGSGPVQVRGYRARNGTDVIATRVERANDDRLILQGPVSARDAAGRSLSILGINVQASAGTEYRDAGDGPMSAAAFFDAVVPDATVVKARGRDASALAGATLAAEQLEVEGSR